MCDQKNLARVFLIENCQPDKRSSHVRKKRRLDSCIYAPRARAAWIRGLGFPILDESLHTAFNR